MAKVTSKLQLTVPKAIADQYGIRPGDNLDWVPAGDAIRVLHSKLNRRQGRTIEERLALFDQATRRQRQRGRRRPATPATAELPVASGWKPHEIERGWRREDLYTRGRSG
jgi:AbrB family looped-hinge helix DNA binding protein